MMRILILVFLLVLLGIPVSTQAATIQIRLCGVDRDAQPANFYVSTYNPGHENIVAYVEVAEQHGNVLSFGDWGIERQPGLRAWGAFALDADSGVTVNALDENGAVLATLTIDDQSRPTCRTDAWQPGAPSIAVQPALHADCYFVQIVDQYGNWHWVEINGERVLLHWGDPLIGSPYGQSTNTEDYRAVATPCPG